MSELAQRALAGCQVSGARIIRWLEDDDRRGQEALEALYTAPGSGSAHVVGVTGAPGSGKSTLVDGLVAAFRTLGQRVGVLAVDPSSPFSGGAILGDRIRMQRHAVDPDVFIRSMATRGRLGGLSRRTFEAAVVLEAMGFERIIVETVGVGQDELEVVELAHTTVVVSVPGLGDDIQALKAGIFEVGDVFVINKSDRPGADETEKHLNTMLHLRQPERSGWSVPLLRTVASRAEGLEELASACDAHRACLLEAGLWDEKAAQRDESSFREMVRDLATQKVMSSAAERDRYQVLLEEVRAGRSAPYAAAKLFLAEFELHRIEPSA